VSFQYPVPSFQCSVQPFYRPSDPGPRIPDPRIPDRFTSVAPPRPISERPS
jgi:hypothetical protein